MLQCGPPRGRHARSGRGNVCIWDGRLDNREELLILLSERDGDEGDLALRLYETRGAAGLRYLIGDWSLVIWDAETHSVVLASDYAGVRPLYYSRTDDRLLWSSSLSHLAEWSGASELDDDYVAGFLTCGLAAGRTPYRRVYPATPGAALRVTRHRTTTDVFWSLPTVDTCYQGDDYEEELRRRFREAVAVRLTAEAPAAAELSGGLDSSSVVCVAASLIASRSSPTPKLTTFSYTHDGSTDEGYIRLVEQSRGLSPIHLDTAEFPFIAREYVGVAAPLFWAARLIEISRQLAGTGSRTFLTGQLGDLVMGNWLDDSEQVADLLEKGHLAAGLREALAWSRSLRVPVYSILWRAVRDGLFPGRVSDNLDLLTGAADRELHGDSLTANFRSRADSFQKSESRLPDCVRPTRRKRYRALNAILAARVLQCPEPLLDVSYSHPFAHRPLVEFMMTLPAEVVCGPGAPRRLMRRAFAGILPDAVIRRRSKATYNAVFSRALAPLVTELLEPRQTIQLVERGYLDGQCLRQRLLRFNHGLECNHQQLRLVILLEFWLRNREGGIRRPVSAAPFSHSMASIAAST